MKFLIGLSILLLSGCAPLKPLTPGQIDPAFLPQVMVYEAAKGSKINPVIVMKFGDTGDFVGICRSYSDGRRDIFINQIYWDHSSHELRQELIFHELSHCDLGQDHRGEIGLNGMPTSIMYPRNFPLYDNELEYYFNELFSKDIVVKMEEKVYHD